MFLSSPFAHHSHHHPCASQKAECHFMAETGNKTWSRAFLSPTPTGSLLGLALEGPTGCRKSLAQSTQSLQVGSDSCPSHSPYPDRVRLMGCLGSQGVWSYSFTSPTLTSCWGRWNRQIYSHVHSPAPGKALSLSPVHSKDCGTSWFSLCLLKATLKRCTMWDLWIKFYLGQNEYGSQGDSTSDSSERLLQRSCGGRSLWMILVKECVLCCAVLSHFNRVKLFKTLWTVAHQVPLSLGFSRQEYWSGLQPIWNGWSPISFSGGGGLPNPGIEPVSLTRAGGFFTTRTTWRGSLWKQACILQKAFC